MPGITETTTYEQIANADPLSLDEFTRQLPNYNQQAASKNIIEGYRGALDLARLALLEGLDIDYATAALRDLDFIAGSLIHADRRDLVENDYSRHTLRYLGSVANTVPRGTVYTYASCNPTDSRERTFTDSLEESVFIDAVRSGIASLDEAMVDTAALTAESLVKANTSLQTLIESMVTVKRSITPEFFTHHMRPYFDNITIDGISYAGPGGAQMQVVALDRMLWGADCVDTIYEAYYQDNARYLTPCHRQLIADFLDQTQNKSIVGLTISNQMPDDALQPTIDLLRTLRKFRYPHRKVAQDNFALRSAQAVGSGQYTPTILDKLIALNERAIAELQSE